MVSEPDAAPEQMTVAPQAPGPRQRRGPAAGRRGRRRPTIHDVAAAAGVSRGTVSRALNGDRYVSAEAMAAVQQAVTTTGYVVNRSARSLVTQRAGSVALVLSEPQEQFFEDPGFGVLLRRATQALAARDITLLLLLAGTPNDHQRVARFLRGGPIDGLLLLSSHAGDVIMDAAEQEGFPAVACGEPLGHERSIAYVTADERGGARQMTRYLLNQGRSRIATITGPMDTPGGLRRFEGFCEALGRRVADRQVTHGDYGRDSGALAMSELLERDPDLDAVFVASDLMAAGALATLRAAGRRVPEDVAIGGFDDSSVATSTEPLLTTIRQPQERIADEAVRLLLELIDGAGHVEPTVLPTELVVRESA